MRGVQGLIVAVGLGAALALGVRFLPANAAGQGTPPPASPQASPAPVFQKWPLPAAGQTYAAIDGQRLWRYVREKGDTAERYRGQGHPHEAADP